VDAYPRFVASYVLPAWFILSKVEGSVPTFAGSLPSLLGSLQTSLRLARFSKRYLRNQGTSTLRKLAHTQLCFFQNFIASFNFESSFTPCALQLMQGAHTGFALVGGQCQYEHLSNK